MTAPKNPKPLGLPITLTAEQALRNEETAVQLDQQRNLRRRGIHATLLQVAEVSPFAQASLAADLSTMSPGINRAERDALSIKASYRVGDTTPSKVDLRRCDIPGPLLLEVLSIDAWEGNPRLFKNEKHDDIKAAIQAQGFHDALVVTRRREGDRYLLAAGSNTTLEVLKELFAATGDERYRWVSCVFQAYESDARLLAQHLGENLNRGDMKFWEIASGMMKLVELIEADRRKADPGTKPMSLREMSEALVARGLRAERTAVARWQFAVQRLQALGSATALLTPRPLADVLQPRLTSLRSLASKFAVDDRTYWSRIVDPMLARYGSSVDLDAEQQLDGDAVCNQVEAALAEHVGESVASTRQMLSVLKLAPDVTLAELRVPSPNLIASGRAPDSALAAEQRPLPLGPAVVRSADRSIGADRPLPSPMGASAPSAVSPAADPASRPMAQGPLFDEAAAVTPAPLQALHAAVEQLLAATGLADTLRLWDDMPLGFFMDLPDPALHKRARLGLGSPEYVARTIKSAVWWQLVFMSGQLKEGCVPYMDRKSGFFLHYAADDGCDPLSNTDIDRDAPDVQHLVLHRVAPGPLRAATSRLREVEDLAAQVLERLPERWQRMKEIQQSTL